MSTKTNNKASDVRTTLFISRSVLSSVMTLRPPTDEQRKVLMQSIVQKWPAHFELKASDELKAALQEIRVAWTDKK